MILKNFWNHKKQNGFVFVEIALIAVLSFYLLDNIVVWTYGNYFCHADGEFEKEHLLVGQTGRITPLTTESATAEAEAYADTVRLKPFEREALKVMSSLYAFRDEQDLLGLHRVLYAEPMLLRDAGHDRRRG